MCSVQVKTCKKVTTKSKKKKNTNTASQIYFLQFKIIEKTFEQFCLAMLFWINLGIFSS